MLINSHCHLNYQGLVEQQDAVLDRARARGIGGFVTIATRRSEWADVLGIAQRHADVWASIGVHPHEADGHADLSADDLAAAVADPRVVAIGETGLDYYYDHSDRAMQQVLFRRHIAVSRETRLPLVIHTRDAEQDTLAILREETARGPFPALIHCFTASPEFGRAVLELGLTISLSGIVTFRNAKDLQGFAAVVPEDRLLVETDAPFLAPVPHRGKTCEPAFVADTAAFVAQLRGVAPETLAQQTTANFRALFTRAAA